MPQIPTPLSHLSDGTDERLRATRNALGLSGVELARQLGVSPQRYNHWETGKHPPEVHTMLRLRQIHRVPLDWIYAGDTDALPPPLLQRFVQMGSAENAPMELRLLRARMLGIPAPEYDGLTRPSFSAAAEPQAPFLEVERNATTRRRIKRD